MFGLTKARPREFDFHTRQRFRYPIARHGQFWCPVFAGIALTLSYRPPDGLPVPTRDARRMMVINLRFLAYRRCHGDEKLVRNGPFPPPPDNQDLSHRFNKG